MVGVVFQSLPLSLTELHFCVWGLGFIIFIIIIIGFIIIVVVVVNHG